MWKWKGPKETHTHTKWMQWEKSVFVYYSQTISFKGYMIRFAFVCGRVNVWFVKFELIWIDNCGKTTVILRPIWDRLHVERWRSDVHNCSRSLVCDCINRHRIIDWIELLGIFCSRSFNYFDREGWALITLITLKKWH